MLRETQVRKQKPLRNSPEIKIKEWLFKNFKSLWWQIGSLHNCNDCPQMTVKPCWNCKRWDSWISDYRKGLLK